MSCCSFHCERYRMCALAYDSGSLVNWHEYGHGGVGSPEFWYCGPNSNYRMFEPVNPEILQAKIKMYQTALEELKLFTMKEEAKHEP